MNNVSNANQEKKIEIQVQEQVANGTYANMAVINHHQSEFTLDFIYLQPGGNVGKVMGRVIMTAENAKKLHLALSDNLNKYEKKYGNINY